MPVIVKSLGTKPGDFACHKIARPEDLVQKVFMHIEHLCNF